MFAYHWLAAVLEHVSEHMPSVSHMVLHSVSHCKSAHSAQSYLSVMSDDSVSQLSCKSYRHHMLQVQATRGGKHVLGAGHSEGLPARHLAPPAGQAGQGPHFQL